MNQSEANAIVTNALGLADGVKVNVKAVQRLENGAKYHMPIQPTVNHQPDRYSEAVEELYGGDYWVPDSDSDNDYFGALVSNQDQDGYWVPPQQVVANGSHDYKPLNPDMELVPSRVNVGDANGQDRVMDTKRVMEQERGYIVPTAELVPPSLIPTRKS